MHWWFSLHVWCQMQLRQLVVKGIVCLQKPRVWYCAGTMTYLQQHLLLQWQPQQLQHQQCLELMTGGGRSTPVAASMIACRFEALPVLAATAGRSSPLAMVPVAHCKLYVTIDKPCMSRKEHHVATLNRSTPKQTLTRIRHSNRCRGYIVLAGHWHNLHDTGRQSLCICSCCHAAMVLTL